LEVELPFSIGHTEIRPISAAMIDSWKNKYFMVNNENQEHALNFLNKIHEKFQGYAAAVISLEAESERVFQRGIEEAEIATSILGIYSIGSFSPVNKCTSKIKGAELIPSAAAIFENGEDIFFSNRYLYQGPLGPWRLNKMEIENMQKHLLGKISSIQTNKNANSFQLAVLNSMMLYSKSAFTSNPVEKIVYILSSLESILLKDKNEFIQQNLAERIAIFSADTLERRKEIILNFKDIYGIRSNYLHHGQSNTEIEKIKKFMLNVFAFYLTLASHIEIFTTQQDFLTAIEDKKLSN
ncbi:MAG: hypothetical protein V4805_05230, partial [Pseudomonadota bacterium]